MSKYDRFYTFDEPVPYKTIKLYPVKVRDYSIFYGCTPCLTLEKKSIVDIRILKMSYLEYLYTLHYENKEIDFLSLLDGILRLCMRLPDAKIEYKFINKKPVFIINEQIFDSSDFNEIRDIICEQNMVEVPDESIQKEIRNKMEEARRLKARENGANNKPASFEDTMLCLVASTAMTFEQVNELTLRKFIRLLQRVDAKLHYQIYMTAAMSGMVEFKDKSILRHWMSDLERENKNDDVLLSFDKVKDHVEMKDITPQK